MVMTWIWALFALAACLAAFLSGQGAQTSAALLAGASKGIQISLTLTGPICLWSGIGHLMEKTGITTPLCRLMMPLLGRIFPSCKQDPELSHALSTNLCANLLGLGNAATPMGIKAVRRLQDPQKPGYATDELCRLVVMNTASIQLLPTTVAAIRSGAGAAAPLDVLPCIWISSILSLTAGLSASFLMGRLDTNG